MPVKNLKFDKNATILRNDRNDFAINLNEMRIKMGQQHNKIEKRNRRKAYLARKREQIKALIKK